MPALALDHPASTNMKIMLPAGLDITPAWARYLTDPMATRSNPRLSRAYLAHLAEQGPRPVGGH